MPGSSFAVEASGLIVDVNPAANASGTGGDRLLEAPGDIFQGDLITTDRGGQVQIRFRDDSRFVVGPNSKVTIDEFVFNPDGTARDVTLAAVKGTFRFIGGNSRSDAYSIRTPTMTIGVRGTIGDFAVRPGGETLVLWQEGTGVLCVAPEAAPAGSSPTECIEVQEGDFSIAPPGGGFGTLRPGELSTLVSTYFPYAGSNDLETEFQVPGMGRPPPPRPPEFNRTPSPYR
jgi:hypothetical protein